MLYESKRFCGFMMTLIPIGLIANLCAMFLRDILPDFWLGYLEGIAAVAILMGLIHIYLCKIKKRNPHTGALIEKDN